MTINFFDVEKHNDNIIKRGYNSENFPVLYPCEGTRCFVPVRNDEDFKRLLEELRA